MTVAKRKPLVPITREFLKQFYLKYPMEPVPAELNNEHMRSVDSLAGLVTKPGSKVPEQVGMPTPTRIDDCFWRNRMICEEVAFSLSKLATALSDRPDVVAACDRCRTLLLSAERDIVAVQEHNTSSVKAQLQKFIPQDFRGALLERQRLITEARYKKQVDDLVKKGGSIRQKYDLYLQQQWERRQALVQLGECSGVYKVVIKWVAGIPQVLLDFTKEINAKLGPLEEQRIKYGPDLYSITTLGIRLDVCLAAWADGVAAPAAAAAREDATVAKLCEVLEPAIGFYCGQMLRVIRFIGNVFQHSPFFLNKEDLEGAPHSHTGAAAAAGSGASVLDSKPSQLLEADCRSSANSTAGVRAEPAAAAAKAAAAAGAAAVTANPVGLAVPPVQAVAAAGCKAESGLAAAGSLPSPPSTPSAPRDLHVFPSDGQDSAFTAESPCRPSAAAASGEGRPPHADAAATDPSAAAPVAAAAAAAAAGDGSPKPPGPAPPCPATPPPKAATHPVPPSASSSPAPSRAPLPSPAEKTAPQGLPPRPPHLSHVDTPSPHLMAPNRPGSGVGAGAAASHCPPRGSIAGDSVISFFSAEENHPWHQEEEGGDGGGKGSVVEGPAEGGEEGQELASPRPSSRGILGCFACGQGSWGHAHSSTGGHQQGQHGQGQREQQQRRKSQAGQTQGQGQRSG